jgi:protein O-mannosyl-transferase
MQIIHMLHRRIFHHGLLFAMVLLVYGNTLSCGFVWDDLIFLVNNKVYVDFDLKRILFSLANGVEYLPVRDVSYALDYALWGNSAAGFHGTNLLLYWLTVAAVYIFTDKLTKQLVVAGTVSPRNDSTLIPLLTAAFFAAHPIHSEIASFITCRNAIISALFFMASCCAYLLACKDKDALDIRYYVVAVVCFMLSLLAKATGITLPLVILLIGYCACGKEIRKLLVHSLPFFVVSAAAFFFFKSIARQSYILRSDNVTSPADFITSKIAVAVQIALFYLKKFFLPIALSAEYDTHFDGSLLGTATLVSLAALLALAVVAVRCRKNHPEFSLCTGWFLATLIPVSNIFSTHPIVADRYAFLPSFAFCYFLAAALVKAGGPKGIGPKILLGAAAILLWGALANNRNTVWQSNKTLWEATVKTSPGSENANAHLGRIYFIEGNYEKAFHYLGAARTLNFRSPEYDFFQGYLLFVRQDFAQAMRCFNQSLTRNGDFIEALYFMGSAHEAAGNGQLAAEYYRRVLRSPEPDMASLKPLASQNLSRLSKIGGI